MVKNCNVICEKIDLKLQKKKISSEKWRNEMMKEKIAIDNSGLFICLYIIELTLENKPKSLSPVEIEAVTKKCSIK